jgi:hypothetical protein
MSLYDVASLSSVQSLSTAADTDRQGDGIISALTGEHKQVILELFIAMLHGIRVRILTSKDLQEQIEKFIEEQQERRMEKLCEEKNKLKVAQGKFEIHFVDVLQQQRFQTKASILIVDSEICLVEDLKEYKSKILIMRRRYL